MAEMVSETDGKTRLLKVCVCPRCHFVRFRLLNLRKEGGGGGCEVRFVIYMCGVEADIILNYIFTY